MDERDSAERDRAYGDVVAALLAARESPATRRFDDALQAAVASGLLDADTARALRWWQRASVREVADHARTVLPPVFAGLVESARSAADAVTVADDAWDDAGGQRLGTGRHARGAQVAGPADTNAVPDLPKIAAAGEPASDTGPESGAEPAATIAADAPAATADDAPDPTEPAAAVPPADARPTPAPPSAAPAPAASAAPPADASLRRRLVVAGLTRTG